MAERIEIEPLHHPGRFLDLQRQFYRDDPHYVPPLTLAERWQVDRRRNPFFEHGEGEFLVARRSSRVVGRISAARDRLHDDLHGDRVGFFGHFEAADDGAAHALLDRAAAWVRERGAEELRGPVDLSTNYRCGLLVEGEPGPPVMSMNHNPPHYAGFLEGYGLLKAKDLVALYAWTDDIRRQRFERVRQRILKRTGAVIRPVRIRSEIPVLWQLYNRIWEKNWGFAPMSEGEFLRHAGDLKAIARGPMLQMAEVGGEPVGLGIAVPDVNVAIRACNGRLLPFGWWTFLRTLKRTARARTLILGLLPEYRKSGLDAVLTLKVVEEGAGCGIVESEAGWVLEDNLAMVRPLESIGFRPYRRYRIYRKPLT